MKFHYMAHDNQSKSMTKLRPGNTPYSKMATASDDLGRVARKRGMEGHDSMFTCGSI